VQGTAQLGCPCIAADEKWLADEAKAREDADLAAEAEAREEESMKIMLAAVEKALWGRSFEGELVTRRPKAVMTTATELPETLPARKRARK
jgi:hypothetical protein